MNLTRERTQKTKSKKENPMTTDVAITPTAPAPEPLALTAQQIRANVNLIQSVLKSVMKLDVHYGIIPGTKKPTLYKQGAEKIMATFRLNGKLESADGHSLVEDLSTTDEKRYRVRVRVVHQVTGLEIGWGIGECSSNETKYKWIASKFPSEWESTPETHRREIWKEGREKPYQVKQVRANISDVANTVLKMAKKRALVDGTLTCTAASDIFDQDIEDLPDGLRQSVAAQQRPPMPQRASEKAAPPAAAAPPKEDFGEPPPEQSTSTATPTAPTAAPTPKRGVDFIKAETLTAKFNAPCRICSKMIPADEAILYIREGTDKGRYCTEHGV